MKKGFTLIELLAVLVILAIIALIAVPIIQSIIKDSKKSAAIRSAELYIDAINQTIASEQATNDFDIEDGTYNIDENGNLCLDDACSETLTIKVEKSTPKLGSVKIEDARVVSVSNLFFEKQKFYVSTEDGKLEAQAKSQKTYKAGDIVYFDVAKGTSCTESEYKSSLGYYELYTSDGIDEVEDYGNSVTGYNGIDNKDSNQNSCLKFYVVSNSSSKAALILDHNTSNEVNWSDDDNSNGPTVALQELKNDTKNWRGTLTPTKYTYNREEDSCYIGKDDEYSEYECPAINYTIDYAGYKARLITAEEVAKVAGIGTNNLGKSEIFYLNPNKIATSELETKVGWIYDRLNTGGKHKQVLGMPNYSIKSESDGYWTATASSWYHKEDISHALKVRAASLKSYNIERDDIGVRPVIEVSKDNLN